MESTLGAQGDEIAASLLETYGSIGGVVGAGHPAIQAAAGVHIANRLQAIRLCLREMVTPENRARPSLADMRQLIDYLIVTASYAPVEQVRVLFLNTKLDLIRDELVASGCVDEVSIYVRPILKRALELGATAVVLVHNHPSGDPMPSKADRLVTLALAKGLDAIGVRLIDHIVVAKGNWLSFRAEQLLA